MVIRGYLTVLAMWVALVLLTTGLPVPIDDVGARSLSSTAFGVTLQGAPSVRLGQNATYWANLTGGSPPFVVHWAVNGTEVLTTNSTSTSDRWDFRPLGNGLFVLTVNATDGGGNRTADIRDVAVEGSSPLGVSLRSAPNSSATGGVTLIASVTGGTLPLMFRWEAPGVAPNWTNATEVTTSTLASGSYPVSVEVRDAYGYTVSAQLELRVKVSEAASPSPLLWVGIGLGIGLAAVLGAMYALRRRRARSPH